MSTKAEVGTSRHHNPSVAGREAAKQALEKAVIELLSDHTELFKQFSDNPSFRQWLSERLFSMTYDAPADKDVETV
jgi:hypothetical protein